MIENVHPTAQQPGIDVGFILLRTAADLIEIMADDMASLDVSYTQVPISINGSNIMASVPDLIQLMRHAAQAGGNRAV